MSSCSEPSVDKNCVVVTPTAFTAPIAADYSLKFKTRDCNNLEAYPLCETPNPKTAYPQKPTIGNCCLL